MVSKTEVEPAQALLIDRVVVLSGPAGVAG